MGKLQHFVPRFYLRSWALREKIHCLQDGKIHNPNLKNVAAENYFYKLQELAPQDSDFLREVLISISPEGLKHSHEELLRAFTLPHLVKRSLEDLGLQESELMSETKKLITELNEGLHTKIENDFKPYLKAMVSGDLSFLDSARDAAAFYKGLSIQYARTNHLKQKRFLMDRDKFERYRRIANPLVHIVATNVGHSLFMERNNHKIMLLDNYSEVPFVTADQPVINISSGPKDTKPPAKFELYYPLSPTKAMLLVNSDSAFDPGSSDVSENFVRLHNLRMAAHSYRQVFSNSPVVLESIRSEIAPYLSCFIPGSGS